MLFRSKEAGSCIYLSSGPFTLLKSSDSWGEKMWEFQQEGWQVKSSAGLCALPPHKTIQRGDLDSSGEASLSLSITQSPSLIPRCSEPSEVPRQQSHNLVRGEPATQDLQREAGKPALWLLTSSLLIQRFWGRKTL